MAKNKDQMLEEYLAKYGSPSDKNKVAKPGGEVTKRKKKKAKKRTFWDTITGRDEQIDKSVKKALGR